MFKLVGSAGLLIFSTLSILGITAQADDLVSVLPASSVNIQLVTPGYPVIVRQSQPCEVESGTIGKTEFRAVVGRESASGQGQDIVQVMNVKFPALDGQLCEMYFGRVKVGGQDAAYELLGEIHVVGGYLSTSNETSFLPQSTQDTLSSLALQLANRSISADATADVQLKVIE